MLDVRELLTVFTPGAVIIGDRSNSNNFKLDFRGELAAALARVRPKWAADLLLAKYADDCVALQSVHRVLVYELQAMTRHWSEVPLADELDVVINSAWNEYSSGVCLTCAGRAQVSYATGSKIVVVRCIACNGRGTRHLHDEDRRALIDPAPWESWRIVYRQLLRKLRMHERAAVATVSEQLSAA